MSANLQRDTAGRLLLAWAVLFTAVVVLSWRIHLHPDDYEWTEYPTALGDTDYYTLLGPQDDRYEPNLKIPGHETGLYRRDELPRTFDDAIMFKLARDSSDRLHVYRPVTTEENADSPVYLKVAENSYIEFGAKKHYRPFDPR